MGFLGGPDGKESACSAGDTGLISGLGRSSGEGNDNPLQYSCLEIPMDRGAWQVQPMGLQRVRHDRATSTHISNIFTASNLKDTEVYTVNHPFHNPSPRLVLLPFRNQT